MIFAVFATLGFIVLRLTIRARSRTILLLAIAIGVVADFVLDLLISVQR